MIQKLVDQLSAKLKKQFDRLDERLRQEGLDLRRLSDKATRIEAMVDTCMHRQLELEKLLQQIEVNTRTPMPGETLGTAYHPAVCNYPGCGSPTGSAWDKRCIDHWDKRCIDGDRDI